jgi:imidazolonepropionase-like amidohydrolase
MTFRLYGQLLRIGPRTRLVSVKSPKRTCCRVAAHAVDKVAIQTAIDAGVDSIEHAFLATDEQLHQMKDKGTFLVATDILTTEGRRNPRTDYSARKN